MKWLKSENFNPNKKRHNIGKKFNDENSDTQELSDDTIQSDFAIMLSLIDSNGDLIEPKKENNNTIVLDDKMLTVEDTDRTISMSENNNTKVLDDKMITVEDTDRTISISENEHKPKSESNKKEQKSDSDTEEMLIEDVNK